MIKRTPVDIMVTNKKLSYNDYASPSDAPEPRQSAFCYKGYMAIKGKRLSIDYDEPTGHGIKAQTRVVLEDGVALISRRESPEKACPDWAGTNTNLIFRQGESCDCVFETPYSPMNLRVKTKSLQSDLGPLGGKLNIDYTIEIMGNLAERNSICVAVCPEHRN